MIGNIVWVFLRCGILWSSGRTAAGTVANKYAYAHSSKLGYISMVIIDASIKVVRALALRDDQRVSKSGESGECFNAPTIKP